MPDIFSKARRLMSFAEAPSYTQELTTRSLTWATAEALRPILPPTGRPMDITAAAALACPPVARGVGLYSSAFLGMAWEASPAVLKWLHTDGPDGVSSRLRDVRTLVDLILHNRSLWVLGRSEDGTIAGAIHVPVAEWTHNAENRLVIGQREVTDAELVDVVVFPGLRPMGLLDAAKTTLEHHLNITRTILERSNNPTILTELKLLETYDGLMPGEDGYAEEFDQALQAQKAYAEARSGANGSIGVTPPNIDLKLHQATDDGAMLINARNEVRIDVANHLNINAAMLDGNNGTSDTYSNTLQNRTEFEDLSLTLFLSALTLRLSMDDITPEGEKVTLKRLDTPPQDAQGNTGDATGQPPQTIPAS